MSLVIYAILDSKQVQNSSSPGIGSLSAVSGRELECVSSHTLTAIVSAHPDKKLSNSRQEVLAYAGIVDKISEIYSILPMRYGSVVASSTDVTALLEKHAESFIKTLHKVMNKQEYSLRLFFSHQHQDYYVQDTSLDVTLMPPDILSGDSENKNYLLKKYQQHRAEEKHERYIEKIQTAVARDLHKITDAVDFKKRTTSGCIIDAVLLVDRRAKNQLLALVVDMQSVYPDHNVILTGPWPPYNFAHITLE